MVFEMMKADSGSNDPDAVLSPLSLIERNLPGSGVDLYIGDSRAASDPELLAGNNIVMVLNCAVNLDINLVVEADPKATVLPYGPGFVRYYKLGIIDGPGNPAPMLLAGYYQLAGLLQQRFPDRATYPRRESGNILVNCRGGRSRSVALAALYLHLEWAERYPTLESAIEHVRTARGLSPKTRYKRPKPVLLESAYWAADMVKIIAPHIPD